jgi:hypothetical protein
LATTDQPYVFTDDDPLNAEDPLGMEALKSVVLQEDAAAKKCKDDPEANGCRGINVLGDVTKAADVVATAVAHHVGDIATVAAIVVCIGSAGVGCAIATGVAFGLRVVQRSEEGVPINSSSNYIDALVTLASGGLLGGTSALGESAVSDSPALTFLLRIHASLPDILGWTVGQATHSDIP